MLCRHIPPISKRHHPPVLPLLNVYSVELCNNIVTIRVAEECIMLPFCKQLAGKTKEFLKAIVNI